MSEQQRDIGRSLGFDRLVQSRCVITGSFSLEETGSGLFWVVQLQQSFEYASVGRFGGTDDGRTTFRTTEFPKIGFSEMIHGGE